MSTTVLEALQNAQCNFETVGENGLLGGNVIYQIALDQLKNAIEAIKKGRDPNFVIQEDICSEVKV